MHQKKKLWMAVLVVLFFLAAGVWYLLCGKETAKNKTTAEDNVNSVFATLTEEPVEPPETTPGEVTGEGQQEEFRPKMIYVYVCGAVLHPGVYELPEESRLFEALTLAGGCLPDADEAYHNLAREVSDGERIYILSKEESCALSLDERVNGEQSVRNTQDSGASQEQAVINLNTATVAQLTTLPGIGESRAESIIEYREKTGGFLDIQEIMNISGIGEAMFEKIKDRITVE